MLGKQCQPVQESDNVIETIEDVMRRIMDGFTTENEDTTTIDDNSTLTTLIFSEDRAGINEEIVESFIVS